MTDMEQAFRDWLGAGWDDNQRSEMAFYAGFQAAAQFAEARAENERLRAALVLIERINGRGTAGIMATLALHPEYDWLIEQELADMQSPEATAFRATLAAPTVASE